MCRVRRWHINERYRTGVGETQGTHISQRCLLSGLYTVAQGMGPRRCPEGLDDDNKHRDWIRRFLQRQNTEKQEVLKWFWRGRNRIEKPRSSLMQRRTPFSFVRKKRRGAQFSLIPGRDEISFKTGCQPELYTVAQICGPGSSPRGAMDNGWQPVEWDIRILSWHLWVPWHSRVANYE